MGVGAGAFVVSVEGLAVTGFGVTGFGVTGFGVTGFGVADGVGLAMGVGSLVAVGAGLVLALGCGVALGLGPAWWTVTEPAESTSLLPTAGAAMKLTARQPTVTTTEALKRTPWT
jgi:hypothetical protein